MLAANRRNRFYSGSLVLSRGVRGRIAGHVAIATCHPGCHRLVVNGFVNETQRNYKYSVEPRAMTGIND